MTNAFQEKLHSSQLRAVVLIWLLVGTIFFSEGIQKFLFPATFGVGRFTKIGIPAPEFFGPFVGLMESICGALLVVGLLTRMAAILSSSTSPLPSRAPRYPCW